MPDAALDGLTFERPERRRFKVRSEIGALVTVLRAMIARGASLEHAMRTAVRNEDLAVAERTRG